MGSMLMIIPVIQRMSRRNSKWVRLLKRIKSTAAIIAAR